jgi:signal transduction histidine kinase
MKRIRRAPFLIAAAVILPLITFLGFQLAFSARDQRMLARAEVLAKTERMLVEADGALQRTLGALDLLATTPPVTNGDWPELYSRLVQVGRSNPGLVTVRLTDVAQRRVLFDLRYPFGTDVPAQGFAVPAPARARPVAFVGDMGGSGPGCPCALVHRFLYRDGRPAHLITVALDTRIFYRIVTQQVEPGGVSGLVDRNGNFVARSIDHRQRVGTPATSYVQAAIRRGRSGIYLGKTWEGFESYTAYNTSALSGWSAHTAFSTGLLDSPRWRSLASAGFAALASLLLASVLIWFTLRQLAEGRRVQERFQEAQKMEALGQITGGIAHDFNNLLTPIIGGLEVIARKDALEGGPRRLLDSALSSARRAAKLTGQLLAFSRRQKMEIGPVDLSRLLAGLKPLLDQSAGAALTVTIAAPAELPWVRSDANQLELALLNLVLNARDAMPDGGVVTLAARLEPERRGGRPMVALEVRDSGVGMPADVSRRAAEPFFTTKTAGTGTGLGLAQVYGTVEQSGGSLRIDSEQGRGTAVTLLLPVCEPGAVAVEEAQPVLERAADGARDNERIILCDDDDLVRSFVTRVLDEAGYIVESVSDGRTAVELVRNAGADLLVVDFAMPGMNGVEVMREARKARPALPVLIITGYADSEAVGEAGAGVPVLRKPFEAGALLAMVRGTILARGE